MNCTNPYTVLMLAIKNHLKELITIFEKTKLVAELGNAMKLDGTMSMNPNAQCAQGVVQCTSL